MAFRLSLFLTELKRRKVYHVGVTYVVVAAGIIGFGEAALGETWEQIRLVVLALLAVGFPIALVLAWAYEVRPEEPPAATASTVEPARKSAPAEASPPSPGDTRESIVVLPFDNMSPDPGDAYFADGLTEEIITSLSHIQSLRVISRNSAMALKGTQKDTRTIAETLGVQYVLEGSVRKAANDLRITAQLIDAASDAHIWAEKYDSVLADIFAIQETVARAIVGALQIRLEPEEARRLDERPIQNLQEYECYLRARHELGRFTKDSLAQGIRTLQQGLELFPRSSVLTATLGEAYATYIDVDPTAAESYMDRAQELATRTLSLAPDSAHGMKLLGLVERARGSLTEACKHLTAAYDADRNDAGIMLYAAWSLSCHVGRPDVADPIFDRLLTIDPLNPINYLIAGYGRMMSGEVDVALTLSRKALEMSPEMPHARFQIGGILAESGQVAEGMRELEALVESGLAEALGGVPLFLKHALAGEAEEALGALDERTTAIAWNDPELPSILPPMFALIGRNDLALKWLRHAVDRGFINYPHLARPHLGMEQLRGERQFEAILAEVKERWEAFEP